MSNLAVVIPAYKPTYFAKALASLAKQTDKNFTVYVGDDHSPHDLQIICEQYSDQLDIHYTRFAENIGSKFLVNQWKRSIELSSNEEWLWLFSDDDLADENCVEKFYETLKTTNANFDVYRFNTIVIDREDNVVAYTPQGPVSESSAAMAYHLLHGERGNSMPDHIFSRKTFERHKGFVFTEYAQAADWASSILFSKEKGIHVIPDAFVRWRMSGVNISSIASVRADLLNGHLQFLDWLLKHFKYLNSTPSSISYDMILHAAKFNLRSIIVSHYKGVDAKNAFLVYSFLRKKFRLSVLQALTELILIKKRSSPLLSKMFLNVKKILPNERLGKAAIL